MESKRSDNLCNYYILPLIGLSKSSFGSMSNFINSYVSTDNKHIIVELKEARGSFEEHPHYVTDIFTGTTLIIFNVPADIIPTIVKFREGRYSQFSPQAKELIKKKSGLNYKVPIGGGKVRSARELLALDKDKDLKKLIEEELVVKLGSDAELVSIPDENNFYELNLSPVNQG
jgi:hypothetical protein